MIGTIYKLTSPSGKCYIGQTTDAKARKREFYNPNKYYSGHKLDNAIKKYKAENFTYEVLINIKESDKFKLRKILDELEVFYIKKFDSYNNGYNMTLGGSGSTGCFQTEESRKKISEKAIGRKGSMLGRHLTEEQRKKVSDFAKTRIGDKNPFYGKEHSEETKQKIAKANSISVIQLDLAGNIINEYVSAKEAARCLGKPKADSEIIKVCKKYVSPSGRHYLTALGYKWEYKEGSTTSKSSDNTEAYTQVSGNGGLSIIDRDEDIV
jgi:group I intron endonuclease